MQWAQWTLCDRAQASAEQHRPSATVHWSRLFNNTLAHSAHLDTQPSRLPVPVGRHPGHCLVVTAPSAQHNTTQHNTTQHNTTQHNTTQHNTTQHNTTQHSTTQHNTTQHNTTQHNTTQHNTTQHKTAQRNTTQPNPPQPPPPCNRSGSRSSPRSARRCRSSSSNTWTSRTPN